MSATYEMRLHAPLPLTDPRRGNFTVGNLYEAAEGISIIDSSGYLDHFPCLAVVDDTGHAVRLFNADWGYYFEPTASFFGCAVIGALRGHGLGFDFIASILNAMDGAALYPGNVWRGEYVRRSSQGMSAYGPIKPRSLAECEVHEVQP